MYFRAGSASISADAEVYCKPGFPRLNIVGDNVLYAYSAYDKLHYYSDRGPKPYLKTVSFSNSKGY